MISPHVLRWLSLALGIIGVVFLIQHGRPPTEPLIGGARDISITPSDTTVALSSPPNPPSGYDGPFIRPNSPASASHNPRSKVVKLTMLYYPNITSDSETYERGIQSHALHNDMFGYDHFILRRSLVSGLWTKQAQILQFLIQELAKPPEDRYEWIFWHDADLVLVNHNIPLEIFLPPPHYSHINWLVANDLSGLNAGVYFLRITEWSVHFFAASLAYPIYKPTQYLVHDEQTAQDRLLRDPRWSNHTMHVPQRWFNAYHNFGVDDDVPPEWHWANGYAEPGDLLVHFPGTSSFRSQLMEEWLLKKLEENALYCPTLRLTSYEADVEAFWENDAQNEREVQSAFWRHYKLMNDVGSEQDRLRDHAVEEVKARLAGQPDDEVEAEVKKVKEEHKQLKIDALRAAEAAAVEEGTIYLNEP